MSPQHSIFFVDVLVLDRCTQLLLVALTFTVRILQGSDYSNDSLVQDEIVVFLTKVSVYSEPENVPNFSLGH